MFAKTAPVPKHLWKNSLTGTIAALIVYIMLQFFNALLIHCEIVREDTVYVLVCITAAISSFVGCVVSVLRQGRKSVLSASAVVMTFLSLTFLTGVMCGGIADEKEGLVGVGVSMATGGLLAALVGTLRKRDGRKQRKTVRSGRDRK